LKGAIAEAAITAAAVKLGFVVLRPFPEGRRYDLVIDSRSMRSVGDPAFIFAWGRRPMGSPPR
jgi:hypothetical protein